MNRRETWADRRRIWALGAWDRAAFLMEDAREQADHALLLADAAEQRVLANPDDPEAVPAFEAAVARFEAALAARHRAVRRWCRARDLVVARTEAVDLERLAMGRAA